MIKFRYIIENQTIETLDVNDVPEGISYQEIFEEIVEENLIIVPEKVTALQFFTQLRFEGITKDAIIQVVTFLYDNQYININTFDLAIVAIDKATEIERNNPLLSVIGSSFQKTPKQLDQIFINASSI